jgi:hypothetical protein
VPIPSSKKIIPKPTLAHQTRGTVQHIFCQARKIGAAGFATCEKNSSTVLALSALTDLYDNVGYFVSVILNIEVDI